MKSDRLVELETLANSGQQGQKSTAIRELVKEVRKLQRRRDAAKGPALSEVMGYAEKIGMKDAEAFHDYHTARGWMMGKSASAPMRDWQAAMRLWNRNSNARMVEANQSMAVTVKSDPAGWKEFLQSKSYNLEPYQYAAEWKRIEFAQSKKRG